MDMNVTTSNKVLRLYRLMLRGAPMMLLAFMNSEGLSHDYNPDSLRVNIGGLSPLERELYKKWDGKFSYQLEKVHDEDSSELYARYFISVFSPVFDCCYSVSYDQLVLFWNKMKNYNASCDDSPFGKKLKEMFSEFMALLSGNFEDIDSEKYANEDAGLYLLRHEDERTISMFYSRSYSLSLNAMALSIDICAPAISFDIEQAPDPEENSFVTPHILDDNSQLFYEYEHDVALGAKNGLWFGALKVSIKETGLISALADRSANVRSFLSTQIELPDICDETFKSVAKMNIAI